MRLQSALLSICVCLVLLAGRAHADDNTSNDSNWPMYGRNLAHTFSNNKSLINPANVTSLTKKWTFPTSDAVSASPTVVDGVVYVGSWDGFFYAISADSGRLLWKFQVDCQSTIIPIPSQCLVPGQSPPARFFTNGGLITSTASVMHGQVIFAGGKTVYSLNARTGSLRWKHVICGNPEATDCAADANDPTQIFSSPAVSDDLIYLGHTAGADGYRGAIEALDVENGEIRWRFEVDPILDADGSPQTGPSRLPVGGINRGCGSVWSSAAVDAANHLVFFGTGDCNGDATPPYHEAILALDARSGVLRWVFAPLKTEACDVDFGASPNLIDYHGQHFVGEGGKDGTYYLLKRLTHDPRGDLVWSDNVVFGGSSGGFFGASFDGDRIFAATALGDGNIATQTGLCQPANPRDIFLQEPSIHAFSVRNGAILWQGSHNQSTAPTSIANGVVFSGLLGIQGFGLNAYDAATGVQLIQLPMPGSVNAAATPLGAMLFVTSGTSTDGSGSGVHAFELP